MDTQDNKTNTNFRIQKESAKSIHLVKNYEIAQKKKKQSNLEPPSFFVVNKQIKKIKKILIISIQIQKRKRTDFYAQNKLPN